MTTTTTQVASVSWQAKKVLPHGVRAAAAVWDGSLVYVLGGDAGSSNPTTWNQIYNPSTDTWTTGAPFTGARDFAAGASLSDGVHLVGGVGAGLLGDHQVYTLNTNTWGARPPLLIPVDAPAVQAVNGKLYVIGGGSANGPTSAVQIFDPATNAWTLGAPMPTARLSAASAKISNRIYVAGGQTAGIGTTAVLERYDPATNKWKVLAPLPSPREALGGGNVQGEFCVFGGRLASPSPSGTAFAQTFCYNLTSNSWASGPNMLTPRVEVGIASNGSKLYALGGRKGSTFAKSTNERLGIASPNTALDFLQSYVNVPDKPAFDLIATWTLEAWVYPRTAGNGVDQDIISKWDGAPNAAYILQIDGTGALRVVTNDGTNQTIALSNTLLANGVWQHVAATFDHGTLLLYINGLLDKTVTGALTPINSSQPLAFGREGNFAGGTLNGRIDEVRLWKVVRSASDLATFKDQRLSGAETGLVGYWRFDEGSGQMAHDATGGGNNGRLGTASGTDSWDPTWTTNAPVLQ